jgi:hypothetical protein
MVKHKESIFVMGTVCLAKFYAANAGFDMRFSALRCEYYPQTKPTQRLCSNLRRGRPHDSGCIVANSEVTTQKLAGRSKS